MIDIQDQIGMSYDNCAIAVSKMTNKYDELILNYANPKSNSFSVKLGKRYATEKLINIKQKDIEDYDLITFSVKKEISHIGLFYKGYCFHQVDDIIVAQEIKNILDNSKYNNINIWRKK